MATKKVADVYITPASGVGGEFPTPIPFSRPYSRKFVENYAQACRDKGQRVRIVWCEDMNPAAGDK